MSVNNIQYGKSADEFKPFDEITLPDPRQENFARLTAEGVSKVKLEELYVSLERLTLNSSAPRDVQTSYSTAKNLALYSWFVYRFQTLAEFQAYATLEYALRLRIGLKEAKKINGLSGCFNHALGQGWFKDSAIKQYQRLTEVYKEHWGSDFPENSGDDRWVSRLKDSIPPLRNTIAHGQPLLHGGAWLTLEICGDLINQLFP